MHISQWQRQQFQQLVLDRYKANKRDLPWRKTTDPYKIMVSECMSQQTQVPRVIPKYEAWMAKWPTIFDVANASRTEILQERVWLWFNRRAINLHEACKKVAHDALEMCDSEDMQKLQKQIRKNMSDYAYLRTLPWVGEYTAHAICAFWYNQEVPVMDINIKRVLLHSFELPIETPLFELQELALGLVPVGKSCEWHNALMDYGSQVLNSKATGIRSAKQSEFKWSDREVRGWILKQLVRKDEGESLFSGHEWLKDGGKNKLGELAISDIKAMFPTKDVEKIVAKLVKDWVVVEKNWIVTME